MRQFIQLNENDNVIIALADFPAGTELNGIIIKEDIQKGHKIALVDIPLGADILKDHFAIGQATAAIKAGSHVHSHNVASQLEEANLNYEPKLKEKFSLLMDREIRVYHRKNWEIGIRNELWILPTVGHCNHMAQLIKERFLKEVSKLEVDGVHVFEHPHGCFQVGEDLESTRKILQNIALHPNTGGVLVLGLGTESNNTEDFRSSLGEFDAERIHFMDAQHDENEIAAGAQHLHAIHAKMKQDYRSTSLLRQLKIGLKYGGFDSMTAVTASPLLSALSDYIIRSGGYVATTGIQHLAQSSKELLSRIESEEAFQKVVGITQALKIPQQHEAQNQGISTTKERSLGYFKKIGTSNIVDVVSYGDRLKKSGVSLVESPSHDLIGATALGAAGCQMVLYVTSEGTPIGTFVPTVKISTTTELAKSKPNWVDFDAEATLATTPEEAIENFINYICDIASGKWAKNEYDGYREIAIWKRGETL